METMMKELVVEAEWPKGWRVLPIEDCLAPINGKKKVGQGWSPQCEKEASPTNAQWGVLKTTAIQAGEFLADENKLLPSNLEPRPQIEVQPGDLLTTCAGPRSRCGVTCLVRETRPRLMISGKMYRYRADKGVIDSEYLEAYLQTQDAWDAIDKMKTGGSDSGLNLTHDRFLQLPIPVAPLPEQRRIVSSIKTQLGRLDAAVGRLHAAKAKLKRYKQAVLKAAVEGRLTEEWREKNAKKLSDPKRLLETELEGRKAYWLAGQRAKLKSAAVKDSDLLKKYTAPSEPELELAPDIPNAWTWCTWDQITNWVTYGFTRPMPHVEEGPPIVTGKNVVGGRITLDGSHRTTQAEFDKLSEKDLPRANDILITKDGTIGRAAVVEGDEPFCINQSVAVAWMRTSKVNRQYLLAYIESPDVQRDIMKKARGVAIKHLSITDFARMNVPLPSLEEQAQIVKELRHRLDSSDEVEATLDAQLSESTRLRQAVLKQAFEGRLA